MNDTVSAGDLPIFAYIVRVKVCGIIDELLFQLYVLVLLSKVTPDGDAGAVTSLYSIFASLPVGFVVNAST